MFRKKSLTLVVTGSLILIMLFSFIQESSGTIDINIDDRDFPQSSASLEGADNILVTTIDRQAEINGFGLVHYIDTITFKNLNNNPITAVFIGLELSKSDDLIFYEAHNAEWGSLFAERTYLVMGQYEMIAVYFDTPLLPQQSKAIIFSQTHKDSISYTLAYDDESQITQEITYTGIVFPLLPYRIEGEVDAYFQIPPDASMKTYDDWGTLEADKVRFTLAGTGESHLDPFLNNIIGDEASIGITVRDTSVTKLEVEEINREIYINPWGVIRIKEEFEIFNIGAIDISSIKMQVPGNARSIMVSDYLGEILGLTQTPDYNYTHLLYKDIEIDFSQNRVRILPFSKVEFTLEYVLSWENYTSVDWFQESINIDMLTTIYQFLGKAQTTRIKIEGCSKITSITEAPNTIENEQGATILVFKSDYVSPLERRMIQFTFQVDIFDVLMRPIVLILIIALIFSSFIIVIKTRSEVDREGVIKKGLLPVNEIREFCSLYEEKTALTLEIRQAEDDTKRKKMAKKKYRNIFTKNTTKIEEIEKEIVTFKKIVRETNQTFEIIVNKLELLEAERISVKDSLKLLETRYKRGRLPSRAAYLKLSDNFLRRRKKIDRSIDKNIQQLRSYLL